MNEFFDNLSKAAKDAAKVAMKMSSDAVEFTKASVNIKIDETKRDSLYKEIGKITYGFYKSNNFMKPFIVMPTTEDNDTLIALCKCIDEIEKAIQEEKAKAANISNKKYCVNCGEKVDKSFNFCYLCGAKQPEIVEEEECCCCEADEEEESCCCCEVDESESCCEDDSCCEDSSCECNDEETCDCCSTSEECDPSPNDQ